MKGRVIVGIVLAAGMATPAVAAADKGGIPSQDKGNVPSCGYGVGGNSAGASNHVAYTEPPQTFACTGGNSASGSYANGHNGSNGKAHAAQAGTIRLGPYREKDLERTFVNHDVDNSHSTTVGDYFTGQEALIDRHKRQAGLVHVKQTITALNGSVITVHVVFVARLRGGHLYTDGFDMTQNRDEQLRVGNAQHIPINRGDGKFAGYSGEVVSTVVKVGKDGTPTFSDRVTLTKAPAPASASASMALAGGTPRDPEHPPHPSQPVTPPVGGHAASPPGQDNANAGGAKSHANL